MPSIEPKESYESVETRIQAAIEVLRARGEENPNIAAAAREFKLPPQRLRARWGGRHSKKTRPASNRKLTEEQELAVCLYLDRLGGATTTETSSTRLEMVTGCANGILQRAHTDPSIPAPVVGEHWARRFLARHPEYCAVEADRKNARDRAVTPPPPPPTTPPPPCSSPQIPLTVRSLKRQGEDLEREAAALPPIFQRRLKAVIKGALMQAQSGAQAFADLANTKAAEKARATRQRSRRTAQGGGGGGGVLCADESRNRVKSKEAEELQKAEAALLRAQHALKKAEHAEQQPFLEKVKEHRKQMRTSHSYQRKMMKALCVEIRTEGWRRRCV
ncbi:hypothetical protein FN846DRAFT_412563 [Sphaerosporella brunnea]|uniref:HTH CENPB-type domain-containing protein n=1 Tax=Sphaerosporella brunnea TaxID=1250544 RepID=A0A5J5F5I1_9PEZI|nr:hypothetical protein FN846DRAFT_412563 [Sphaerosporella brunnea]